MSNPGKTYNMIFQPLRICDNDSWVSDRLIFITSREGKERFINVLFFPQNRQEDAVQVSCHYSMGEESWFLYRVFRKGVRLPIFVLG